MGFAADITRAAAAKFAECRAVHVRVADLAFDSIVNGSALTGAPGQPVAAPIFEKAGALKASWKRTQTSPNVITIWTDFGYADDVEDNLKGFRFRSGGPHGVKLTVLAAPRLVSQAMQDVTGGGR
jgi:hypothetical protein